ncbi:hypothetical protein L7F22_040752 [Adiantum nelumboides]|nr:hypothetical protein [Adiantum nelumboides]
MEDNGIDDSVTIENFHLIVKPELRGPIEELQGQHSVSWRNFKVALKAEYFLEDSQRVTKQTFIKWVQMKNKGLTSRELLREFEKKFDQLSTGEQQSLRSEKVELFMQAVDSHLQKSLVQLLEDPAGELGLTNDWDVVPAAINLLVKRQKRIDKSIVVNSHEDFEENGIVEKIVEKSKASSSPTLEGKEKPKATQSSTLDDSTMDDLIKDEIEDVAGLAARIAVVKFILPTAEQTRWDVKDAQAHALIVLSVKRTITPHIPSAKSAKQAWDILVGVYAGRNEAKIALLRKELELKIMNEKDDMDTFRTGAILSAISLARDHKYYALFSLNSPSSSPSCLTRQELLSRHRRASLLLALVPSDALCFYPAECQS